MRRVTILCQAALLLSVEVASAQPNSTQTQTPDYVGSDTCVTCHPAEYDDWRGSHHDWALKPATAPFVLGDFEGATFTHKGVVTRFFRQDGIFMVETDGPDGRPTSYEIQHAVGVAPLQQYLVETEPGRLQALDIAWDTVAKRWFHLYPEQEAGAGTGLHWSGPYKSWNARCASCHVTGYRKNYRPRERRYESVQAEASVTCEACHGPGEAHLAWAEDASPYDPSAWAEVGASGLTIGFSASAPEQEIEQCAGCHSRRGEIGGGSPLPGTRFHSAYRLALLRPGLYHADGQILDEVYVYGSFLQSKMHARGVRCTDCHEPHSATMRAEGNAVCTRCHDPAGDDRFPTLPRAAYDTPRHHFHPAGSDGALCKSCHMIERVYMGVDGRRDHSFRIPRPELSAGLGTPNACTDCHADRAPEWAAAEIARRFPERRGNDQHHAAVFAAAAPGSDGVQQDELLAIAKDVGASGIVRATALALLRPSATPSVASRAAALLADPNVLVRGAAVALQAAAPGSTRLERLAPMILDDPQASVRLLAARALVGVDLGNVGPATRTRLERVFGEFQKSLFANSDFPEVQLAIAGTALALTNLRVAEAAFREAVRLDPQLPEAWAMIARLRWEQRDPTGASAALEEGIAANPEATMLRKLRLELHP